MDTAPAIDPALLRAFALSPRKGSFTRAAERVGRTQSAVSMQVQRLEALLGPTLLLRGKGGAVHLTSHGRYLLERSREVLALNDEIWSAFRTPSVQGTVRLGTPDDYAVRYLPGVLRRFALSHPAVDVDVLCAPSYEVVQHLRDGELDLTLCSDGHKPKGYETVRLWEGPLRWVTSARHAPHRLDPLPLALAMEDHSCPWRHNALRALEQAGRALPGRLHQRLAGRHARAGHGRAGGDGVQRDGAAGGVARCCRRANCRRCRVRNPYDEGPQRGAAGDRRAGGAYRGDLRGGDAAAERGGLRGDGCGGVGGRMSGA